LKHGGTENTEEFFKKQKAKNKKQKAKNKHGEHGRIVQITKNKK